MQHQWLPFHVQYKSELVQLISLLPPMFADQGIFAKMQDSMQKT